MTTPTRSSRSFWSDARFFIGVAVVIVCVLSVWFIVHSSRETAPALQSTRTIVAGEVLTGGDFRVVQVGLGSVTSEYLSPEQLSGGVVAARTIASGELLAHTATAPAESLRTTTVVLTSVLGASESLTPGTPVQLWFAPPLADSRGFEAARVLVSDATVAAVTQASGMLATSGTTLELVIDRRDVAAVLTAVTDGSALSVVPRGTGS